MKPTRGTYTKEGFVPYRKHPLGFDMPVKLVVNKTARGLAMAPLKDKDGYLVYALPGGGEYLEWK